MNLYGRYFWYLELTRATQVLAAYVDGRFAGVLLAEMKGEEQAHRSFCKSLYVKVFDFLQNLLYKDGAGLYEQTTKGMLAEYLEKHRLDGEILFLAADPEAQVKGIGTVLLGELERREPGKEIFLVCCIAKPYRHLTRACVPLSSDGTGFLESKVSYKGKGAFMYSSAFCKVYNQFGWNYFPEAFGEQLLTWLSQNQVEVKTSLDLACGTGVLCEILHGQGVKASGMDFSEGMIAIARERNPEIAYEVADMITYRPDRQFDLVTCTGDALNHIMKLEDIERIFANVYAYLHEGGYFIFDILNEKEVPMAEPIDLDFSETVKAQFMVTQDPEGRINLQTVVYENGIKQFEETIKEIVHDEKEICRLLEKQGFQVLKCANHFLENQGNCSKTWYVIARKCLK